MKKKINISVCLLLTALVLLSACLSGCGQKNEKGFTIPVSAEEKSVFELSTTMYNEATLTEIYNTAVESDGVEALDKKFPLECLRKDEDGYRVMYVSSNEILVLEYDADAKLIKKDKKEALRRLIKSVAMLDYLKIGDSVHVVQAVDQRCFIPFMAGVEGASLMSDHYSEDGYHTRIEYDDQHRIKSIDTTVI